MSLPWIRPIASPLLALCVLCVAPRAQCLEWTSASELPGFVRQATPPLYDGVVRALEVFDDGGGDKLVAAGEFANVGSTPLCLAAEWNGNVWSAIPLTGIALDNPFTTAHALFAQGSDLYIGGRRWIGSGPVPIGFVYRLGASPALIADATDAFVGGEVDAFVNYHGSLHAAGRFESIGNVSANCIAKLNGSVWQPLAGGLHNGGNFSIPTTVSSLAVFGDKLYAAGNFVKADTTFAPGIASWDGTSWANVGAPQNVWDWTALAVFDDGTGPALYATGAGILHTYPIVRFDGATWSAVGTPHGGGVFSLTVFDDGSGSALYAAGAFSSVDGVAARRVAKWNGVTWSALDAGIATAGSIWPPVVFALESFDDGSGLAPALAAGGEFNRAGGNTVQNIAAWRHCSVAGTPYCFGDGSLATLCPCAPPDAVPSPSGAPDAGCANSVHLSGAKLYALGTTNPDLVRLHSSSQTPNEFAFVIAGNGSESNGVEYGDGVRCAGGSFVRFGGQSATGSAIVYPNPALGLTHPLHVVSGVTPGSGQTRYYQVLYRDTAAGFCNSGTFNLTNAISIVW